MDEEEETRIRMQMMMLRERWMHSLKFSEKRNIKRMARPRPRPPNPSLGFFHVSTHHSCDIYCISFSSEKRPGAKNPRRYGCAWSQGAGVMGARVVVGREEGD